MPHSPQIRNFLHVLRRRQKRTALASDAMLLASVLLLIGMGASAAGPWVTTIGPARVVFLTAALAALSVAAMRLLRGLVSHPSDDALALHVETRCPHLRSRLISSVQLQRAKARGATEGYYSDTLIDALVNDTEKGVARVRPEAMDVGDDLRRNGILLGICLLAVASLVGISPERFGSAVMGLFHPSATNVASTTPSPAAADTVAVGDIALQYFYPAYTGLEPKTVRNSNGDIRALRGSEVHISARASEPVKAANLLINAKDRVPMAIAADSAVAGRVSVTGNGSYQFELIRANGTTFLDPAKREIAVQPDEAPKVDLIWPAEDMEATERETIPLDYAATDDFGLTEATLVVRFGDAEKRIQLASLSSKPKSHKDTHKWDLATLDLEEVQELMFFIEAKDNDAVSGPNVGRSEERHIAIQNARRRHEELIEKQERLLKQMLHLLATDLTRPLDAKAALAKDEILLIESTVRDSLFAVLDLFGDILAGLRDDPLANHAVVYALEDMHKELQEISGNRRRFGLLLMKLREDEKPPESILSRLAFTQHAQVETVEKDILVLHALIEKQRRDNIRADLKKLADAKGALAELLERLKKGDATAMKELRELTEQIERMMQKIAAEMAKVMRETPIGTYMNPDAINAPGDLLEKLREALARGDREEALRLAREMMAALEALNATFANADEMFGKDAYGGMLREMDELMTELDALAQAETGLLKETKDVKNAVQQRTHEQLDDKLRAFFEKQLKRLEKIKGHVGEADSALGGDRAVKEYYMKDEERRHMAERMGSLDRMFGPLGVKLRGGRAEDEINRLNDQMAELSDFLKKKRNAQELADLMRDVPNIRESLAQLKDMLSVWDVQESWELAMQAASKFGYWHSRVGPPPDKTEAPNCREVVEKQIGQAQEETTNMLEDLEKMRQEIENYQRSKFKPPERESMKQLSERQRGIMEKTQGLRDKMAEMQRESPFLKDDPTQDVSDAMGRMEGARSKLDGERPGSAVTDEREAVFQLEQAKARLKEAQQRIAQGMMGEGMKMPGGGQTMPQMGRRPGMMGARTEKVKLPSPEDYKVPKEFREEILKAMQGSAPEQYRKLNEDYYKKLLDQ
ncbi:MAG: DUF4175 family protein [Planctomycetota bacterium]